MRKLAIIGASYLQEPLITKAKEMGLETHVFAWKCGDIGEKIADFFYPISITERELILAKCREIGIDGICTIASDLATLTVSYVAEKMNLSANSVETSIMATNKHEMRKCFERNNIPSPKSVLVKSADEIGVDLMSFPVIVKPLDRSGSRGITKVESIEDLCQAVERAKEEGFEKKALVEEFAEGNEYSVEYISWRGEHTFLAITEKFTTGAPRFIEIGHIEPAEIDNTIKLKIKDIVPKALDSLGIVCGASHTELKIDDDGNIKIIEIGGRMGGDFIGSHLVQLSTGYDFVKGVILCALGEKPNVVFGSEKKTSIVKFAMNNKDCEDIKRIVDYYEDNILKYDINMNGDGEAVDSSSRKGYCLGVFDSRDDAIESMFGWRDEHV